MRLHRLKQLRSLGIGLVLFIVMFLSVYPLIWLLFGSVWSSAPGAEGHFTTEGYIEAYTKSDLLPVLFETFYIVGMTVLISVSLAIFLAWIVTRTNTPGSKLLEKIILVAFFLPPSLTIIAWILLASPNTGTINLLFYELFGFKPLNIFSRWGIIWHLVISFTSFGFMLIADSFRFMDSTLEEAARTAGGRPFPVFFKITLPLLAPAIISVAILIFIRGIETFESPAFLGLPAGIMVFITKIYDAMALHSPPRYTVALALSVTMVMMTLFFVLIQWWYMKGKSFVTVTGKNFKPTRIDLKKWKWVTLAFVLLYFFVTVIMPISQLIVASFMKIPGLYKAEMFTFDNYRTLFDDKVVWRAFKNTLILSLGGAFLCMVISSIVSYIIVKSNSRLSKPLDFISWLPWAIPGMVLALGILWGYISLPKWINPYGTLWILLIAYVTMGLPLGVRSASNAFRQISNDLEESARVHGATWWTAFRSILITLIRPSFISGLFILFILFSRELSASILLYSYGTEVISVLIFEYWHSGRSGVVSAISILFIFIIIGIWTLQHLLIRLLKMKRKNKQTRQIT